MIADFTWEPNRYEFEDVLVEDETTKCHYNKTNYLCLHKFEKRNRYGETEEDVYGKQRKILSYMEQKLLILRYSNAN